MIFTIVLVFTETSRATDFLRYTSQKVHDQKVDCVLSEVKMAYGMARRNPILETIGTPRIITDYPARSKASNLKVHVLTPKVGVEGPLGLAKEDIPIFKAFWDGHFSENISRKIAHYKGIDPLNVDQKLLHKILTSDAAEKHFFSSYVVVTDLASDGHRYALAGARVSTLEDQVYIGKVFTVKTLDELERFNYFTEVFGEAISRSTQNPIVPLPIRGAAVNPNAERYWKSSWGFKEIKRGPDLDGTMLVTIEHQPEGLAKRLKENVQKATQDVERELIKKAEAPLTHRGLPEWVNGRNLVTLDVKASEKLEIFMKKENDAWKMMCKMGKHESPCDHEFLVSSKDEKSPGEKIIKLKFKTHFPKGVSNFEGETQFESLTGFAEYSSIYQESGSPHDLQLSKNHFIQFIPEKRTLKPYHNETEIRRTPQQPVYTEGTQTQMLPIKNVPWLNERSKQAVITEIKNGVPGPSMNTSAEWNKLAFFKEEEFPGSTDLFSSFKVPLQNTTHQSFQPSPLWIRNAYTPLLERVPFRQYYESLGLELKH